MFSNMLPAVALVASLAARVAVAVNPVEVRGQDFFDTVTNNRVMIVGVDYQPGGQAGYMPQRQIDALSDGDVCLRDAVVLQSLGVNTIRVYNVDPTLNHDDCASIFNYAGIYMIIDVNSPLGGESINRAEPWTSYHEGYLTRIFGVVENFKNYPNTLGFFSANEVMNDVESSEFNPPYIRAVQRDLKNYISKHVTRTIPVGYSAADVREILEDQWNYMQCSVQGEDDNLSRSDFFGLNSYSWCGGDATPQSAGYTTLAALFDSSTIPVFFSEYGCNEVKPRVFEEVPYLYGPEMTMLSGGLVYEYSQEEADYGLVDINDNGTVSLRVDFDNLQTQYRTLNITLLETGNSTAATLTPPRCSANLISNAGLSKNFTLPRVPPGGQQLIDNGIDNPTQGRIVDVSNTRPSQAVYGSNGQQIQNLELRQVANGESNTPTDASSGTGTNPASSPSPTTGAAGKVEFGVGYLMAAAAMMAVWTSI
ncbi:glycoside hydrolase family 72 protein [Aulographum hederae CBS 113979]|uniref:1,3-beta-glucanosyltransferase n=1 Tax=Aulographum hederae CBS 113979 TaxID=1176131 RepID=A0A6G1GW83_9PEZI|nr:glycoside hydrolase family 72 protein [Aulographum hederae CBS 113979]